MGYIDIVNLKLNKYIINLSLNKNLSYGVFSFDQNDVTELLLVLAGINDNNGTCLLNGQNTIFDNDEYFKNRLYLDLSKKYLKTLNANSISSTIINRFDKQFNIKNYKDAVNQTNIRSEVLVTDEYKFTDYGINLSGYCLLKGLDYKNIIINNPINRIRKEELKKTIINSLTDKSQYDSIILGINNVFDYKDIIDRYLIFSDYNNVFEINPKEDTFLITDDSIFLRNRIYKRGIIVITINDYSKDELRQMLKNKQKYRIVSFYEVMKYLGDDNG